MAEALIIVNPTSASGGTGRAWPGIASDLATHFGGFKVAFTERSADGTRLAAEAAERGIELIVACGGDGTINEVANGILNSGRDVVLGVLPSGTGGDFRRTLDIPTRAADAAAILRTGKDIRMDVGRARLTGRNGEKVERYFLGIASFGLSGDVIMRAKRERSEWMPALPGNVDGKLAYAKAAVESVLAQRAVDAMVQIDEGRERRLRLTNLCVANARYFGGGMKIAPDAKLTDGQFDVVLIGDLGAAKIFANAHRLLRGTHLSMDDVYHVHARRVEARPVPGAEPVLVDIDGELPGSLPASFEIVPAALSVRVPA